MRHVRRAADDAGQAVHRAELGVSQRHPAQQGAHGHFPPGRQVLAVGVGGSQACGRAAKPLAGEPVS